MGYGVEHETVRVYTLENQPTHVKIPDEIAGLRTETISTSGFRVFTAPSQSARPVTSCGVSVGHYQITAGTLGCLVELAQKPHILSNNHVLANTNNCSIGDYIMLPGPADGTTRNPSQQIGKLADFEAIDFNGTNQIDATVASINVPGSIRPDILSLGSPSTSPVSPHIGLQVAKRGRTTGLSFGHVVDLGFNGYVNLGTGKAWFEDQLGIGTQNGGFSAPGDSGSLVLESLGMHPVGLLFAGDDVKTLANPIEFVLNRFSATVIGK